MKTGCGRQSFLVVFDFDHTVVDCNTDEVIPAALGRAALQKQIITDNNVVNANYGHDNATAAKTTAPTTASSPIGVAAEQQRKRMQWTHLMDTLIAPFSKVQLEAAAREKVVVAPGMQDVFRFLTETQEKNRFFTAAADDESGLVPPQYLELNIASDSNLLFIEAALDATLPGVRERISQIHSNPYYEVTDSPALTEEERQDEAARDAEYNASMTERKSRLLWYERKGNGCDFCAVRGSKPNMCKSKIIKRLLATTQLIDPTIIFVGDGGNDYCPVLNVLRPRDFVFVRRGFPLHRMLSTGSGGEHASKANERLGGCCAVGLWQNPQELQQLFKAVVTELPFQRLPTLTRFYDVSASEEFRAVTLRRRMADIVARTLKENEGTVSAAGRRALVALQASVASNGVVPPLPGQSVVPAWLRNSAFVFAYDQQQKDGSEAGRVSYAQAATGEGRIRNVTVAPRWGQLSWLHGEIYFYHLFWQLAMLKDDVNAEKTTTNNNSAPSLPNYITPYEMLNPLYSQQCEVAATQGMVSAHDPAIPFQNLDNAFLVTEPAETESGTTTRTIAFRKDGEAVSRIVPYSAMTEPAGSGLLRKPKAAGKNSTASAEDFFLPYHDIFQNEKRNVLVGFIQARVAPMVATRPWAAPRSFGATLLRWMLWGNGLDLSMFTIDQLAKDNEAAVAAAAVAKSEGAAAGAGNEKKKQHAHHSEKLAALVKLHAKEKAAAEAQDVNIVGNELEQAAKYLHKLLRVPCKGGTTATSEKEGSKKTSKALADAVRPSQFRVDVVMDNVGVECIADLCFGLWFVHHASKKAEELAEVVAAVKDETERAALQAALSAAKPTVTYHVKPQPYYVSDVTPRDFEDTLSLLEQSYTVTSPASPKSAAKTTSKEKAEKEARKLLRKVLQPFVKKVRETFTSGAFLVDGDTVWTQPSEYRDLPPRVINRYFYTQTCVETASKRHPNISSALSSRRAVQSANKASVEAKTGLVLFKGDLNYRRLIGDRHWDRSDFLTTLCPAGADGKGGDLRTAGSGYSQPQRQAVAELLLDTPAENVVDSPSFVEIVSAFWPVGSVPVISIRTIKSECCVGVSGEKKVALDQREGRAWRVSGKYGVILFAH